MQSVEDKAAHILTYWVRSDEAFDAESGVSAAHRG